MLLKEPGDVVPGNAVRGAAARYGRRQRLRRRLPLPVAILEHPVQDARPLRDGAGESLLLDLKHAQDERAVVFQLRVHTAHLLYRDLGELPEEGALDAKSKPEAHGAPDDAAEHVTAAGVAGDDTVADQERCGARVLGNRADSAIVFGVLAPFPARQLLRFCDYRPEQVRVVQGGHALEDRRRTLQPHSGVDVLIWQRRVVAVDVPVELRENQVVDLDKVVVSVRSPPVFPDRVVRRRDVVQ